MDQKLIARVVTTIRAPIAKVWEALVTPEIVKRYMFGTTVVSDWKKGSSIVWKGEWQGKPYEDRGVIREVKPPNTLHFTHSSPLSNKPDVPENHHTVTVELREGSGGTELSLTQENNSTDDERARSEKNWNSMLEGLKKIVEE